MIEAAGPVYFLVYETRHGPKRQEIKINPKEIDPRREALKVLPRLVRRLSKKDETAKDFRIEEIFEFRTD